MEMPYPAALGWYAESNWEDPGCLIKWKNQLFLVPKSNWMTSTALSQESKNNTHEEMLDFRCLHILDRLYTTAVAVLINTICSLNSYHFILYHIQKNHNDAKWPWWNLWRAAEALGGVLKQKKRSIKVIWWADLRPEVSSCHGYIWKPLLNSSSLWTNLFDNYYCVDRCLNWAASQVEALADRQAELLNLLITFAQQLFLARIILLWRNL